MPALVSSSSSSVDNITTTSSSDGWNDSQHSMIADFFHRHCPKITKDVMAVGKDIKTGFQCVADIAHQAKGAGEDIFAAIKRDGGIKNALQDAVSEFEAGKNPLKGIISQEHVDALKSDAAQLKENVERLMHDGKPLEEDIVNAMVQAKNASGDVLDLVKMAGEIYSGQMPPGMLQRLQTDIQGIIGDLGRALQWNSTAVA